MQRSSLLELALAQCALLVSVVLLVFFTSGWLRLAIAALWLFQIARLHLQVLARLSSPARFVHHQLLSAGLKLQA